ncbi:MAG: tRNA lysidine(34) synthetase TilS, partial [Gemmatimonadaceae bacterium]
MRRAVEGRKIVLAVSGGRDSMVLLHAAARAAPSSVAAVATFDHGTGPAATRAAALVASVGARLGFPVVMGHAATVGTSEEEWRGERRRFLSEVADRTGAVVATAHTRDDQLETVLMRVLRDAGARGLAGLYAPADTLRPLLEFTRDEVTAYAFERDVMWVDDPTNESMRYFRNRVRRDLLPALARVHPAFGEQLLGLSRRAGEWRARIDAVVARLAQVSPGRESVRVSVGDLSPYSPAELSSVWPAIAARVGLAMDR